MSYQPTNFIVISFFIPQKYLSTNCIEDLQTKFAVMTFDPVKLPTQSGCPDYNSELVIFIVS